VPQPTGIILCIQTPGEENSFSRRVFVQAANRFAGLGYCTLIFDPFGVGDSAGQTSEVRLQDWRSDLMRIAHHMRLKYDAPFFIWGSRLGSLLAADLLISQSDTTAGLMLWAPLAHGRTWVDQLQQVSTIDQQSLIASDICPQNKDLKRLGGSTYLGSLIDEINGLSLTPTMQHQSFGNASKIALFGLTNPYLVRGQDARKPPALEAIEANWRESGFEVHTATVPAENYWSATPTYDPITLFEASEAWLTSIRTPLEPHV
jgi:pimeloyl-ACP methyl ester carboxylesterase